MPLHPVAAGIVQNEMMMKQQAETGAGEGGAEGEEEGAPGLEVGPQGETERAETEEAAPSDITALLEKLRGREVGEESEARAEGAPLGKSVDSERYIELEIGT